MTPSEFKSHLRELLATALHHLSPDLADQAVELSRPKQAGHGDLSCNVALQLARPLKKKPADVARALVDLIPPSPVVERVEVAGAGFINFFLADAAKRQVVHQILKAGKGYGRAPAGSGQRVQVEFVSANPTGPLHVGHGRGAAYGASLANVLEAAGHTVTREYYVNDAGRQMDILALSTWFRYLELEGVTVAFPPNAYQGDYVRDMAWRLRDGCGGRYGRAAAAVMAGATPLTEDAEAHLDDLISNAKKLLGPDWDSVHGYALAEQLADCRNDLTEFGVTFDQWFSERSLYDGGLVARTVGRLEAEGHAYRQDGALWFRSTKFGDEKDRVIQRDNGQYTYFASDIAYHLNKLERGFQRVIDVWGADHHGYIPRVKGALQALGLNPDALTIALVQFAVLYREGKKVSMSTRAGEFVTLRELRGEVGNDAARFFYVLRKSDQHLDFDLDLAKSQSNENPVYYIQYAHARVCSVLEQWGGHLSSLDDTALDGLASPHEGALIQALLNYPETVETAAAEMAPHLVSFYLKDLAGAFHSYYNAEQFLVPDEALRHARLALVVATRQVLANGLALLGVSAPERM